MFEASVGADEKQVTFVELVPGKLSGADVGAFHASVVHHPATNDLVHAEDLVALYAFINSERFRDLFKRIDTQAEKLLDLQVKEKKAHDDTWKTQGELIRSVQKVQAEICNEIEYIIGSANTFEQAVYE